MAQHSATKCCCPCCNRYICVQQELAKCYFHAIRICMRSNGTVSLNFHMTGNHVEGEGMLNGEIFQIREPQLWPIFKLMVMNVFSYKNIYLTSTTAKWFYAQTDVLIAVLMKIQLFWSCNLQMNCHKDCT